LISFYYCAAADSQDVMNKPKRQHWVPRFYLKEFATPESKNTKNPQVWIYSRTEGDPAKVNVKDIAVKRYLYSPEDVKGERCWKTEDKLADLESLISRIWPKIANDFVDLSEDSIRKGMSLFIATMILRHPKKLAEYRVLQDKMITLFDDGPKDEFGRPALESVELNGVVRKVDTSDWELYSNPTEYDYIKFFVDQITNDAHTIANLLMKKRWSIVFSEKPCFITTDNPVITFNLEKEIFGIETKGTFVNFPISPTRVLLIDDRLEEPHSKYYPLTRTGAGPSNITAWQEAHNFMITGRDPAEVVDEMLSVDGASEDK
jgi:hypothetical protein